MDTGYRKILIYRPGHVWLGALFTGVLLLVAAYLVFDRGKLHAGTELAELRKLRKQQTQEIAGQQHRIRELSEQVAVLQRSSEIDRRASQEVRNEFSALQEELLELRKELDFYRGIMAPDATRPGLRVEKFAVTPAATPGNFAVAITLTQVRRNDRYASGMVELEVEGLENGKSKVLVFSKPGAGKDQALNYKFRYFQHLQGEIWIPEEFQPLRVKIIVKPKGKGQPAGVEEIVDWPA